MIPRPHKKTLHLKLKPYNNINPSCEQGLAQHLAPKHPLVPVLGAHAAKYVHFDVFEVQQLDYLVKRLLRGRRRGPRRRGLWSVHIWFTGLAAAHNTDVRIYAEAGPEIKPAQLFSSLNAPQLTNLQQPYAYIPGRGPNESARR
jgi:hypothetical protein